MNKKGELLRDFSLLLQGEETRSPARQDLLRRLYRLLEEIDDESVGKESHVGTGCDVTFVRLVHALDPFMVVDIVIGLDDVLVRTVGMTDSVRSHFPSRGGVGLEDGMAIYLKAILKGGFAKVLTTIPGVRNIRADLIWKDLPLGRRTYVEDSYDYVRNAEREKIEVKSYEYVAFIDNKRPPPKTLLIERGV